MPIIIAGLGFAPEERPPQLGEFIAAAGLVAAGRDIFTRLEENFKYSSAHCLTLDKDLDALFSKIWDAHSAGQTALVLSSGDPLFFGVGASLRRWVESAHGKEALTALTVIPNISSLQGMAARLALPWENIPCVSLHGRSDLFPLWQALAGARRQHICILTDPKNHPAALARALSARGCGDAQLHIFSRLGSGEESYVCLNLAQAQNFDAPQPSAVLLECAPLSKIPLCFGRADDSFVSEKGLMTKGPARAAALAALRLEASHTLWDLGAGSGAMSLEAAALLPEGRIFAVERLAERAEMIFVNRRLCAAWQVEIMRGETPACLGALPDPDRIFIGGGLKNSLATACKRLKPDGRLVINCVLQDSLHFALEYFAQLNWPVESTLLQASQGKALGESFHFAAQNPVFILAATRPDRGGEPLPS